MATVFISYERSTQAIATEVGEALEAAGHEVWSDSQLPAHRAYADVIEERLAAADAVLVLWSAGAARSQWVRAEAEHARERDKLIQAVLDDVTPPLPFSQIQCAKLQNWNGNRKDPQWRKVLASVDHLASTPGDAAAEAAGPLAARKKPADLTRPKAARARLIILAVAAVVVLAPLAYWLSTSPLLHHGRSLGGADSRNGQLLKLTVSTFSILGDSDASLRQFTGGLQAAMVEQLSNNQIDVIEPGQATVAAYGFDGTVEHTGNDLVVRARLYDARQHVTVWSEDFRRETSASASLQTEVANIAAQAANTAVHVDALAKGDPETVRLLIKSSFYSLRNRQEDREAEWQNAKLLVAKLPGEAGLHSDFAINSAFLAATTEPQRADEMKAMANKEASEALKINPHDQTAYLARSVVYPLVGHWGDRESALLSGLKVIPDAAGLANHLANLLREVGRLNDAVLWARRAEAPQPPSANREATLLLALAAKNETAEAVTIADRIAMTWPVHPASWNARLQASIFGSHWEEALALLQPEAIPPDQMSEDERKAFVMAFAAMKSGSAPGKAKAIGALTALPSARLVVVQPPNEVYSPAVRIGMIAVLGGNDQAFAEASEYLQKDAYADSAFLFWPNLEEFRRDKRFFPLVSKIGLVDYWRNSRTRPDFCSDPQLPYACPLGPMK